MRARQLSRYSNWLRAGRSGGRIPVGVRFSAPVQTDPWAHRSSCTMGTGSFAGGGKRPGRDPDPSPLLAPRSIKQSRATPRHSLRAFVAWKSVKPTYLEDTNKYVHIFYLKFRCRWSLGTWWDNNIKIDFWETVCKNRMNVISLKYDAMDSLVTIMVKNLSLWQHKMRSQDSWTSTA
jgi:hypothetical protein